MKDFLKTLLSLETPFGEVVVVVVGVSTLLILGLISFNTALSWFGAAAFLGCLYLTIFFASRLWKKWRDR